MAYRPALQANIQILDQRQILTAKSALLDTTVRSHQALQFLAKEELFAPKADRNSTLRIVQKACTARQERQDTFRQMDTNVLQVLIVQQALLPQYPVPWEPSLTLRGPQHRNRAHNAQQEGRFISSGYSVPLLRC